MRLLYSLCIYGVIALLCVTSVSSAQSSATDTAVREPSMFLELGYSFGGASAHPGMRAASMPPLLRPDDNPQFDGVPFNDAYMPPGYGGCPADATDYCVRVNRPGFTFVHGLHGAFGGYFNARWGMAGHVRYGFGSGPDGTLRNVVVGVRGLYKLTRPRLTGFHASLYLGVMAGQIQVRPRQAPTPPATDIERPWGQTGLGGADLGVKLGYRFAPTFGIFLSPEAYVMFPRTSLGLQATAGIDFAFGNGVVKRGKAQEPPPEDDISTREALAQPTPTDEDAQEDRGDEEDTQHAALEEDTPTEDPGPLIAGFTQQPDGRWKADDPIGFELNSATLRPESKAALASLAGTLNDTDGVATIQIVGHADERGPDRINDPLSTRRAQAVRNHLVRKEGVAREKIEVEGRGAHEPAIPHATTETEHEANRRVEIYLTTQ